MKSIWFVQPIPGASGEQMLRDTGWKNVWGWKERTLLNEGRIRYMLAVISTSGKGVAHAKFDRDGRMRNCEFGFSRQWL